MTIEEKYKLAMEIVTKQDVPKSKDVVSSIAEGIDSGRFLYELSESKIVLFLTWEDSQIDGKRYIFVNNLWIDPTYRSAKTLTRVRTVLKYLLKGVHKFYWFNREKQKMIYRS